MARGAQEKSVQLESYFYECRPTQCWYYIKAMHALLVPSVQFNNAEEVKQFQENFILADGVTCFKNMLVKADFLEKADDNTKK
jgi:hypothetical protein